MSLLKSAANLPVGPNVDASHIAYSRLKTETGSHAAVGPFLPSVGASVNTLTSSLPVLRMVTMAALTAIETNRIRLRDRASEAGRRRVRKASIAESRW
ncbi:phosphotransacetylase [Burkholderia ambifaria]|nr:phosphotransacetylase [Burkholderia ambifaria]